MKPKVAFFDFACCEGCQLQIADLEEELLGVLEHVELVEFREVMTGQAPEYDIAFIEGSITRPEDEDRLKDIRRRAKVLVAFGACATTGGVNKIKNLWPDQTQVRRTVYGDQWNLPHLNSALTKAVDEVVKVDLYLHGCPINRNEFLSVLKTLLTGGAPQIPDYPVCVECKLRENVCMYHIGKPCLGPITRAGCEAICPTHGASCEGCRGTVPNPNQNAMHEVLAEAGLTVDDIRRMFTMFALNPEVKNG